MLTSPRSIKGFTLIELLVVIAILSILLVIVLVAINPARQTKAARNTQRKADVLTILNAVGQYYVATGSFPGNIDNVATGTPKFINSGDSDTGTNFCNDLVPTYVAALPFDPFDSNNGKSYKFTDCPTTPWDTGYTITKNTGDRITISSIEAEDIPISVSR